MISGLPVRDVDRLHRFVVAQQRSYDEALAQLRQGHKTSHWIWFIFPQIAGLGRSDMALRYAIANYVEAVAYLRHPLLGSRLHTCTEAMMAWASRRMIKDILGSIDALKFRSSMTLFEAAGAPFCTRALENLCAGQRDDRTLALLRTGSGDGHTHE